MNNVATSLVLPLLLTACVSQTSPMDAQPEPQPVTQAQLDATLASFEARLEDTMFQQNAQLSSNHHAFMTALQQDIKTLKKRIMTPPPLPPRPTAPPPPDTAEYPENETRDGKLVVGETETVWLDAVSDSFPARIDTGATTSSLSAQDITVFERDGKPWVSFNLAHEGVEEKLSVETPLVRYVRIRQASADSAERRPVVALTMRLGRLSEKTEFTLTDRSQMTYPVLLGREFLKDIAVVDIARQNVQGKPKRPTSANE
ncbi:ATP-dependent zinc protease family protein [Oceanisphaera psychrotolerans]|uniref:ATP-dependent Zn protease n=1 Tax=Oceanisphaera psychrotolerans TaxID=1414654 RepID=A0A1J4QE86_9GAMM|nr:ATP-dependent zinc protease [Oceanisphaera psychrotolerans]OIN09700.1 ATP-dependent Zn protease [Oceanisphaera psychrotolerans]